MSSEVEKVYKIKADIILSGSSIEEIHKQLKELCFNGVTIPVATIEELS